MDRFLSLGYAGVAIVGYRTYPDASISEQVEDAELALAWFQEVQEAHFQRSRNHSSSWGGAGDGSGDGGGGGATAPPRVVLVGHSSGGHLITQISLRHARQHTTPGLRLPEIAGVCTLSAPFDLLRHHRYLSRLAVWCAVWCVCRESGVLSVLE